MARNQVLAHFSEYSFVGMAAAIKNKCNEKKIDLEKSQSGMHCTVLQGLFYLVFSLLYYLAICTCILGFVAVCLMT